MAVHSAPTNKRKNPPTFRHLPRNRAQKLKKSWVEKKKLQARWRAQKRKEGLGLSRPDESGGLVKTTLSESESELHPESPRTRKIMDGDGDETGSEAESGASSSSSNGDAHDREDASIDEDSASERPPLRRKKARTTVPQADESEVTPRMQSAKSRGKQPARASFKGETKVKGSRDDIDPLRELTRRAYAPSSLHTFKADPLHRRKDATTSHRFNGVKAEKGKDSKHPVQPVKERSDGLRGPSPTYMPSRQGHQRRGQPNMKIRMEAMLERIKRDYS